MFATLGVRQANLPILCVALPVVKRFFRRAQKNAPIRLEHRGGPSGTRPGGPVTTFVDPTRPPARLSTSRNPDQKVVAFSPPHHEDFPLDRVLGYEARASRPWTRRSLTYTPPLRIRRVASPRDATTPAATSTDTSGQPLALASSVVDGTCGNACCRSSSDIGRHVPGKELLRRAFGIANGVLAMHHARDLTRQRALRLTLLRTLRGLVLRAPRSPAHRGR